jgi:hypothetical protein
MQRSDDGNRFALVDCPWLRYSKYGRDGYNTFELAIISFVFHTLHTMGSMWRCQLAELGHLESGRHLVCVTEKHRYYICNP